MIELLIAMIIIGLLLMGLAISLARSNKKKERKWPIAAKTRKMYTESQDGPELDEHEKLIS